MYNTLPSLSFTLLTLLALASFSAVSAQTDDTQMAAKSTEKTAVSLSEKTPAINGRNNSTERMTTKPLDGNAIAAQKHYETGLNLQASGKYNEAVYAFKRAIKLVRDYRQAHYSLGMAYYTLKNYKEAGESFKLAVRFDPDWADAHFQLGLVSFVLGKKSDAIEEYKKLQKLNSPFAKLLERIIRIENTSGRIATSPSKSSPAPKPEILPRSKSGETLSDSVKPYTDTASNGSLPKVEPSETAVALASVESSEVTLPPMKSSEVTTAEAAIPDSVLTSTYKVGVGDVLDIRLFDSPTTRSTLYTVANAGVIDFPLAGMPIAVVGLTTEEIQTRIAAALKRLAVQERPQLSVGMRQYASHDVIVTGFVNNPGTKFLRREGVPLYVIMAEAQLRMDAGRVSIIRSGSAPQVVNLSEPAALNFIVRTGDVINVDARPQEFYYIGGRINYPGQKAFQSGITVLQAILAAGGITRQGGNRIEISREAGDGRLTTTKYILKEIKNGTVPDPKLKPGDRIEVVH